jgi:hypothetical protein
LIENPHFDVGRALKADDPREWAAGPRERVMQRAVWAIMLVLLCGCGARHELTRTPSPDGALDAVLAEVVGSQSYEVYVVRRGATLGRSTALVSLEGAMKSTEAAGASLHWLAPEVLAVEYLSARAVKVNASEMRVDDRNVRILANPGVATPAPGPAAGHAP